MTPEQLARLVTDSRLTPESVRVVLYVSTLGTAGEEFDVKGEDLAILLGGGEKPIRAAIKRAEHCGYLRARHGGRAGHKLTLLHPENDAPEGGIPERIPPLGESFPKNPSPGGVISAPVVVGGGDGVEPTPSVSPPEPEVDPLELDPSAEREITENKAVLNGASDDLRAYLRKRVPPGDQYHYVRAVLTGIQGVGLAWGCAKLQGGPLPLVERSTYLAAALNQLGVEEVGPSGKQAFKSPPGSFRNLATKLQILLNPDTYTPRRGTNGTRNGSATRGGTGPVGAPETPPGAPGGRDRRPREWDIEE